MIVIIGYDEENFITNDPGTVRGEEYAYNQDLIMDAIHDWNGGKQTILSGQKALLVVK